MDRGRITTPIVKVVVFGLACLGLWAAGQAALAIALLAFSAVINGLAQLPRISALQGAPGGKGRHGGADGAALPEG